MTYNFVYMIGIAKFETGLIPITYHDPRLNLKLAVMTTLEWKVTRNITKECFTKFTELVKPFVKKICTSPATKTRYK